MTGGWSRSVGAGWVPPRSGRTCPWGRLGRARGERPEWWAAGLVVLGLAAVLIVVPQREPPVVVAVGTVVTTAAVLGGMAVGLFGLAVGLPARVAAVALAARAAICFGLASGMARLVLTGTAPFPVGAALAVVWAEAGLAMAQFAYRRGGGLGAPLGRGACPTRWSRCGRGGGHPTSLLRDGEMPRRVARPLARPTGTMSPLASR